MRTCLKCGNEIPRRANQSNYRYSTRKYCSQVCCRAYMKENHIGWFATSPTTVGAKKKHKWNDLDITPYLNNDDLPEPTSYKEDDF